MITEDQINVIEDNDFMNKDVSQLVKGDFYLFHMSEVNDTIIQCVYKDGVIYKSISNKDEFGKEDGVYSLFKYEYTSGTLHEWRVDT